MKLDSPQNITAAAVRLSNALDKHPLLVFRAMRRIALEPKTIFQNAAMQSLFARAYRWLQPFADILRGDRVAVCAARLYAIENCQVLRGWTRMPKGPTSVPYERVPHEIIGDFHYVPGWVRLAYERSHSELDAALDDPELQSALQTEFMLLESQS